MRNPQKNLRARRAGVLEVTAVLDLQEQVAHLTKLADTKQVGLEIQSRMLAAVTQRAENDRATFENQRRNMSESLIQERMLLVSQLQRIDQRLRVIGIEPSKNAFSLVLEERG